jgi:hypothetical protein
LATSAATSFLSAANAAFGDMSAQQSDALSTANAVACVSFEQDTTRPELVRFELNMDGEPTQLSLTFSEVINLTSIQFSLFTITSGSGQSFNFTTGLSSGIGIVATINISKPDADNIRLLRSLATNKSTSLLQHRSNAFSDMAGNQAEALCCGQSLEAAVYTQDRTGPTLDSFTLDLDTQLMVFTFNEPMDAASFVVTQLSIQDALTATTSFTLTGGSFSTEDSDTITLVMTQSDVNSINDLAGLANGIGDTFISFTAGFGEDTAGNSVQSRVDGNALVVSAIVGDSTAPELISWSLDMNLGRASFTFSETVIPATFNTTKYEIQGVSDASSLARIALAGNITATSNIVISLNIAASVLDQLKVATGIATSRDNSFISFPGGAVEDASANPVAGVPNSLGLKADSFVADSTSPKLISWDINLNASTLTLQFSEAVKVLSLATPQFTLQHAAVLADSANSSSLTTSSTTSSVNGATITITLSSGDLNNLAKARGLCVDRASCFLSLTSSAITDMNNRPVEAIVSSAALGVDNFVADAVRPVLNGFDLDLDRGIITFSFSEIMDLSALLRTSITIQGNQTSDGVNQVTLNP